MQLVSRFAWGARAPTNRTVLKRSEQRGTGVHYSGSAAEAKDNHDLCAGVVRSIQSFHMDSRGWSDIAYSYLVCIHGAVFEGRGRGIRTAANGTTAGNDGYHAVCFLGGDLPDRADVTPEGLTSIRQAVLHCNAWAGATEVRPHSFFKSTGCPGDELRAWIARGMPVAESSPPVEGDDMTEDERAMLKRIHDALFNQHTIDPGEPFDALMDNARKTHQALVVPGTTTAEDAFNLLFARVRKLEAIEADVKAIKDELIEAPVEPPPGP